MALSARRLTKMHGGHGGLPAVFNLPVTATKVIYPGALVVARSGACKPGVAETGDVALGRAEGLYDNSGSLTPAPIARVMSGVFSWDQNGTTITNSHIGTVCYVYDDHTVTLSSSSASVAGVIVGLADDGQVMVKTDMGLAGGVGAVGATGATGATGPT